MLSSKGSKMIGWQLCYDLSHPQSAMGRAFLYHGPTNLSLRLVKLDKGLHQYLLEAVYTSLPPVIQTIELLPAVLFV